MRAHALADDAAGKLERRIPEDERPFKPADLHLGESQIGHHALGGDGQTFLLQIDDAAEAEQHPENTPADAVRQRVAGRDATNTHVVVGAWSVNESRSVT